MDASPLLLVLGDPPAGTKFKPFLPVDATSDRIDAVALFSPFMECEGLTRLLDRTGNLFAPVADFTGKHAFRNDADASPDPKTVSDTLKALSGHIEAWRIVEPLPEGADRLGLFCLGLAHTRGLPITCKWTPGDKTVLWYPLIGPGHHVRAALEELAVAGLLRRRFARRLHICGACGSHRLTVFEACVACESAHLNVEYLIHHFRCGAQAPETGFLRDNDLICPKCSKSLRHYGVDYAKPGQVTVCQTCRESMDEPQVRFVCMDCGSSHSGDLVQTEDWFDYEITAEGVDAFAQRHLPWRGFDDLLATHTRAFSRREFALLAAEGIRIARRYGRESASLCIRILNAETLRREHGAVAADEMLALTVELFAEELRDTDFFTSLKNHTLIAMLPETTTDQAQAIAERFVARVLKIVAENLVIDTEVSKPKRAIATIETIV